MLLALLACTGDDPADSKPDGGDDSTVPVDTADADTDADTDTDTDTDHGPHTRDPDTGCATPGNWYLDADRDGYGDPERAVVRCDPPSLYVADAQDCDDTDATINPLGTEVCDGADDDCDGETDEYGADGEVTLYPDADGDGWGVEGTSTLTACSPRDGYGWLGDCDDGDASVSPGAAELCDGLDQDCDGVTDDDAGQASFDDGSGVLVDVTDALSAGDRYDPATFGDVSSYDYVATSGTLYLCDGWWYLKLLVTDSATDLVVKSRNGPESTVLTTDGVYGGAMGSIVSVLNGSLSVEGVTLSGGIGSSGTNGGAVAVNQSAGSPAAPNLTLTDCVVTGNETDYGGGVAIYGTGWVSLVDTRVEGNDAAIAGGGVWMNSSGRLDCEASTLGEAGIVSNTSPIGGGVYLSSSTGGTVSAVGCDWGDDDAGDDNEDYDVEQNPGGDGHQWCWTDAASLTTTVACSGASCTDSTDSTCP